MIVCVLKRTKLCIFLLGVFNNYQQKNAYFSVFYGTVVANPEWAKISKDRYF